MKKSHVKLRVLSFKKEANIEISSRAEVEIERLLAEFFVTNMILRYIVLQDCLFSLCVVEVFSVSKWDSAKEQSYK